MTGRGLGKRQRMGEKGGERYVGKRKDFLTAAKHDSRQKVLLPIASAHTARHPRDAVVLTVRPDA